jgi:hypothetical protein
MLTPEIQARLDQKHRNTPILVPDGDTVYMSNGEWVIVLTGARHHLDDRVLEVLEKFPGHAQAAVDWRIINAQDIDNEAEKFLPHRGRKARDILRRGYYEYFSTDWLRNGIEKHSPCIFGDGVSLTDLLEKGDAYPVYEKGDKASRSTKISRYVFRFEDKILSVNGDYLEAFHQMGFRVHCPAELYFDWNPNGNIYLPPIPVLGVYLEDVEPDIFGYIQLNSNTDVWVTDDGRKMQLDAGKVCWLSPEQALQVLQRPEWYTPTRSMWENTRAPMLAIDSLRWKGLSDEQIEELYEDGRNAAYQEQYRNIIGQSDTEYTGVQTATPAQLDGYRKRAQRREEYIEAMGLELGQSLDPHTNPDIIRICNERIEMEEDALHY